MNPVTRRILRSIGIAIIALILVNVFAFVFEILVHGIGDSWAFRFKHGVFYHNENPTGLEFGHSKTWGFVALVAIVAFLQVGNKKT
ncbi:MAG: hypothetical protein GYB31_12155 [Bacteroidetes bacterium]|nr:hypothetical protein [Bacteroidota bacterium]